MIKKSAALLLLPNLLADVAHHELYLPVSVDKAVKSLDGLIAESDRGGRKYLSRFFSKEDVRKMPIALLTKHTKPEDYDFLLEPIQNGERWGLISDAGLPCIADPGSNLVYRAYQLGILTQAFIGPSSIFLALMLSGISSQHFSFWGYLPIEAKKRTQKIHELEMFSKKYQSTQVFMETPYRNQSLLKQLIDTLSDTTYLGVWWDLTLPTQGGVTQTLKEFKKSPLPNLEKRNAVFLIK